MMAYISLMILPFIVLVGGFHDLLSYRIPQSLSLLLVAGFFLFAVAVGMPLPEIGVHLLAGLGVLLVMFTLFSFRLLGGGDAKLLSAIALWIGHSEDMMLYGLYMSLFGGALSLFLIYFRKEIPILPPYLSCFRWIESLHGLGTPHARNVPYAIAIAAGLISALPHLQVFQRVVES